MDEVIFVLPYRLVAVCREMRGSAKPQRYWSGAGVRATKMGRSLPEVTDPKCMADSYFQHRSRSYTE